MIRTYCDRCGGECTFRTGHLHLIELHQRAGGEQVSSDEYTPFHLCGACIDLLRGFLGDNLRVRHYDYQHDGEAVSREIITPFPAPP